MLAFIHLDEEARHALRRDLFRNAFPVYPGTRLLNALLVQVGSEDLHLETRSPVAQKLQQGHGQRAALLARGAARRPHSDGPFVALILHDGGINLGFQRLESFKVAEEAGHGNENVVK